MKWGQKPCPLSLKTTSFLGQEKTKKTYKQTFSKKVNLFPDKTTRHTLQ